MPRGKVSQRNRREKRKLLKIEIPIKKIVKRDEDIFEDGIDYEIIELEQAEAGASLRLAR